MKLDLILHHIQKSTQNGLKTNLGLEIIKLLEENTGESSFAMQKPFNLIQTHLVIFAVVACALNPKNH